MRKHFYLITEHEDDERVGLIGIADKQYSRVRKNEESPIHVLDEDEAEIRTVGKRVGMGYVDFEDEDDYDDRIGEVTRRKLGEIDEEWLEKAGHEPEEVFASA